MCGIVGSYGIDFPIQQILDRQTHRGPDAMGSCVCPLQNGTSLQLGHNRLKIIDLSDTANQPFSDPTRQHIIVFNGEIYNYKEIKAELIQEGVIFTTDSDTEVLLLALRQWHLDALQKLNGMFAFAYLDLTRQTLYLVRDRFGVKPLYYFSDPKRLVFASTSASIATMCGLAPNFQYIKRGLQFGIYEQDSGETAYQSLHSVPPGQVIVCSFLEGVQLRSKVYYQLEPRVQALRESMTGVSTAQWMDETTCLLQDACRLRLQADVPVALALSGGLDSATLAAVSSSHHEGLHAFCFGSPTNPFSEGPLAAQLAARHGINIQFINPPDAAFNEAFWQTLQCQDAPFPSLSIVAQFLLYQHIKKAGFTVVIGGQAGDELFLGYRKFQWFHLRELIEKQRWLQAARFFVGFSQMIWAERARLSLFWRGRSRYQTSTGQSSQLSLPGDPLFASMGYSGDLQGRQLTDILKFSLPTLLRYEDRNSMAHSIESRLPFMDYRLVELACAVPTALKLQHGYGKWMLRELMINQIPNEIRLARYKRGFDVAQNNAIVRSLEKTVIKKLRAHPEVLQFVGPDYLSSSESTCSPQRFSELVTLSWLVGKV